MAYKTDYERQRDDAIRRKMVAGNRHGWQDMGPLEDLMWNAEERIAEAKEPLEKLCQDLQGQVNNLKLELSQTATTKTNLEQRWTKLAGEKYSLQDQLQSVQKALEASSVEGTRLQDEVQTITASRYHFETVSKTLAEEKKKLEDSLRSTKGELAASRRKVEEHDEAKETFQKDLNVLTEAKTRAEKEIEKMTHIVKYLKEEAKIKYEEYRELESKYKEVLEDGRENAQLTEKLEDAKLKLQKAQSDLKIEQKSCALVKDTTKHLRTEIAQLNHGLSSQKREVQALKDKGNHRREVMQQMGKSMQDKVDAVRSDLDQERYRQSDLKDSRSAELLLTRSYIVRLLKTELVSRATELQKCKDKVQKCKEKLQKCRDELKTTTAERDKLSETIAMQKYMDQHFHKLQEQMRRNLVQIVTKVIAGVHEVSAGVSELDKEVQQLQDQTSSTSSVQQSLTGPAPVSKNLTEDGTHPQEMLCMSQPQSGVPNALVKYQPGGAEGASVQCSSSGSAMDFGQGLDSHARTTGQPSRTPLQELMDPSLLQQALTLQKLMPYIPDLADKGSYIAGYLDMQKQWDSLASSHPELGGRLQKLLSTWLEGEDIETPHTWGFFISLVQEKGIGQHQLARKISSNLNASAAAPNSA